MKIQITQRHIEQALEQSDRTTHTTPLKVALRERGYSWVGIKTDVFESGYEDMGNYSQTAMGYVSIGEFGDEVYYFDQETALSEDQFKKFIVQRSWDNDTGFEYPEGEINLLDEMTDEQKELISNWEHFELPDWD